MGAKRYIIGISGASGSIYGIRLLEELSARSEIETHLVITEPARLVITQETGYTVEQVTSLADGVHDPENLAAPIASGSFSADSMVVAPCSVKMLSAVANSYTADLVSRAADVTLKEGRPLVLLVRETPLHLGHLRLMARAAEMGAIIFPPVPVFYGRPQTVADIVDGTVGRVLARLGVENALYARWVGGDE